MSGRRGVVTVAPPGARRGTPIRMVIFTGGEPLYLPPVDVMVVMPVLIPSKGRDWHAQADGRTGQGRGL